MIEGLRQPWPWWVAGPLIGLVVPAMLLLVGRPFGVSSSFRDICAAAVPGKLEYLRHDWKANLWRLAFVAGILAGAILAVTALAPPDPYVGVSAETWADLGRLGVASQPGLVPSELFTWGALATLPGLVATVVGGFLVGFGARWADGCTSGHAITGLSCFQLPSLLAVVGFFAGGLVTTHWLLPLLLGGAP